MARYSEKELLEAVHGLPFLTVTLAELGMYWSALSSEISEVMSTGSSCGVKLLGVFGFADEKYHVGLRGYRNRLIPNFVVAPRFASAHNIRSLAKHPSDSAPLKQINFVKVALAASLPRHTVTLCHQHTMTALGDAFRKRKTCHITMPGLGALTFDPTTRTIGFRFLRTASSLAVTHSHQRRAEPLISDG
ncbi:hypothetical protein KIPB_007574, partial [Kipferlia bialata]|eukprot:g7574.t1